MNPAIPTSLALLLLQNRALSAVPGGTYLFSDRVCLTDLSEQPPASSQDPSLACVRCMFKQKLCDIPSKNQTGTGRGQTYCQTGKQH